MSDVRCTVEGHVGVAEICRGPDNYFDKTLIGALAAAFEGFDADPAVRCIVLCSEGRNFCAGADFVAGDRDRVIGSQQGGICISRRCGCSGARRRWWWRCRGRRSGAGWG